MRNWRLSAGVVVVWVVIASQARGQGTAADYERTANLRTLTQNKVFKAGVVPHWIGEEGRFWYRNELQGGEREFLLVDPLKCERRAAFDHERLAEGLTKATGKEVKANRLPIDRLEIADRGEALWLTAGDKNWKCDLGSYTLTADRPPKSETVNQGPDANTPRRLFGGGRRTESPDGKWVTFVKDANLYLREKATSNETALSKDGKDDDAHAAGVLWSPDSKKLVAFRTKKGEEHKVYLIESSPRDQVQPKLQSSDYLKPGDRIPITKPHLFDVADRREIPVSDELFSNPWSIEEYRWAPDSKKLVAFRTKKGQDHKVYLIESSPRDQVQPKLQSSDYLKPGDRIPI
ncbi:MAG TPA: DPP IV N-terminal domain-containing protein, partial [Gemmataceae bacterium]